MNDSIREILKDYTELLEAEFGGRLLFTGLQGSHARGEAALASDIDLVCVLDSLDIDALKKYAVSLQAGNSLKTGRSQTFFLCVLILFRFTEISRTLLIVFPMRMSDAAF